MLKKELFLIAILVILINLLSCATNKDMINHGQDCNCNIMHETSHSSIENFKIPKVIHLSDIHIGSKKCETEMSSKESCRKVFKQIVNNLINWGADKNLNEYVIIITGDLTNNANKDYVNQMSSLIDDLKYTDKNRKIKRFRDVLVIPGNHDYKLLGGLFNKNKICNDSIHYFKEIYYGKKYIHKEFPKIDIIDRVAFIGLDSMAGRYPKDHECGSYNKNGKIGKTQLCCLEKIISKIDSNEIECDKFVIYLHHPPKKCDLSEFITKIKENKKLSAILFGHTHDNKPIIGKNQPLHNSGTTTGVKRDPKPIKVIDLEKMESYTIIK